MKKYSLSKKKRLVSNRQFKNILAHGRCVRNNMLILYVAKNNCDYARLGISVGKTHGNAVLRNRLKRLLREAFRLSQDRIPAGFDYLLMVSGHKETSKILTFEQIKNSFLGLAGSLFNKGKLSDIK